jgi:hypothetical protein
VRQYKGPAPLDWTTRETGCALRVRTRHLHHLNDASAHVERAAMEGGDEHAGAKRRANGSNGGNLYFNSLTLPAAVKLLGPKRRCTMRFLMKISFPVESGNAAAKKDGFKAIQQILAEQKPEAAYFLPDGGRRTGILILNMEDASQLAAIAEP